MKTIGNGWENTSTVPVSVFFGRVRERERESRTGKQKRYYGISGAGQCGREYVDYDRENINYDQEHQTRNHFKHSTRRNCYNHGYFTHNQINTYYTSLHQVGQQRATRQHQQPIVQGLQQFEISN